MNVFKYIWYKLKEFFTTKKEQPNKELYEEFKDGVDLKLVDKARKSGWLTPEETNEVFSKLYKQPVTDQRPPFWLSLTEDQKNIILKSSNKPKRQYNRATKKQVARIKLLVGRGKSAKEIAQDVGLPYDNVNYYVKKFGKG